MGQRTRRSAHGSPLLFDRRAVYADQSLVTSRGKRAGPSAQGEQPRCLGRDIAYPAHGNAVARFTAGVWRVAHDLHALAAVGRAGRVVEYSHGPQAPEAD